MSEVRRLPGLAGTLSHVTGLALCAFAVVFIATVGGCSPPYDGVFKTPEGETVTLESLQDEILNNEDLTEEEKRQELQELGFDEDTIDLLIREYATS